MTNALLVSTDPYVISEMQQIAGVTGARLEVTDKPSAGQVLEATHIFVDAESVHHFSAKAPLWVVVSGPAGPQAWKCATQLRAEHIVSIPEDRATITQALAVAKPRRARMTAVIGLVPGIGTSTAACHVAAMLSRDHDDVVLIDTDVHHGGLEIVLGREENPGTDWTAAIELMRNSQGSIGEHLPRWNELAYLASPASAKQNFESPHYELIQTLVHEFQHIVVDIAAPSDMDELIEDCDNVCFIVPNTLRAIAIAKGYLATRVPSEGNVGLVVRDIPGSALAPLMVAQTLDLELWGSLPTDPRVVELIEQGLGPIPIRSGSFNRSISQIVQRISLQESQLRAA